MATHDFELPRWQRDLTRFLPLKPQFVLSGNVRDLQLSGSDRGVAALPLTSVIAETFRSASYGRIVLYDPVGGFRALPQPDDGPDSATALLRELGLNPGSGGLAAAGLELFAATLERIVQWSASPIALIADFASRLVVRRDALSPPEHQAFTRALVASHQARPRPFGTPKRPFFNSVVWIVEREGDLPDWLVVGNPRMRHIPVAKPDHRARLQLAGSLLRSFDGFPAAALDEASAAANAFAGQTEGLLLVDLAAIAQLARSEGLGFRAIGEAVRHYKVGVKDDPWARLGRERVAGAAEHILTRVKGQDRAVTHMLDIVKRATTGVGAPGRGGRPRGVAFLAGPTGVGKTELAKALTSLLFGDESAYIRFDMSEFSAEHSDQRLIGAPPGYVGYDAGGELTNAVREKPFSVVLFDEIEKAHPRILDKFLQILDDGVLTSGRGDRVYFSEAFVIFTSNLGIYRLEADGARVANVSAADAFPDVEAKVRSEIERYFKLVLNRPEILNRIGDNILIFDFIRPDVADAILSGMLASVADELRKDKEVDLRFSTGARADLRALCVSDLSNGGRGIRNKVETHLLNPLARAMFDRGLTGRTTLTIESIAAAPGDVTTLTLTAAAKAAA